MGRNAGEENTPRLNAGRRVCTLVARMIEVVGGRLL